MHKVTRDSRDRLVEYARAHGLRLVQVPGDGNCLFSSLVAFLASKNIHMDIHRLKSAICARAAREPGLIRDPVAWKSALMINGTYGDAMVLYLVQRMFKQFKFLVYDFEDDGPCYNNSHMFIKDSDIEKLDSCGAKSLVKKSRKIKDNWCILLFSGYNHYDLMLL